MIVLLFGMLTMNSPVLIEQANLDVSQIELDAALYEMPADIRNQVAYRPEDLETILLNHLKYEFVYDYIIKNNLTGNDLISKEIHLAENNATDKTEDDFITKLKYDKELFLNEYALFLKKKYLFSIIDDYFESQISDDQIKPILDDMLASEPVTDLMAKTTKVTVLEFPKSAFNDNEVVDLLKKQIKKDEYKNIYQLSKSDQYNEKVKIKDLTLNNEKKFNLPFLEKVFNMKELGMIKNVFSFKNFWYLVRINDVFIDRASYEADIRNVKKTMLKKKIAKDKVQAIINQYTENKELKVVGNISEVFERYKFPVSENE